jgi:histidinol-phosphate aminotransferase
LNFMHTYERVTVGGGRRLHLNENTAGCSPAVIEVLRGMTRQDASFYPDYEAAQAACAAHLGRPQEEVLLTNGLDEGILAITASAFKGTRDPQAIVVLPAFDMYSACADALGGQVVSVPPLADFAFPLDAVLRAIDACTRVVWLTNPNNPTGQLIPRDAILRIAAAAPQAFVAVDEAYADFCGATLLDGDALDRHPNLVVGRTFAKAHGLAGLRAGALVASTATLEPIRRIVPPYSINAVIAAALPAALGDRGYLRWYLGEVEQSKTLLYAAFDRLGVLYWPSHGNFVLARPANAGGLVVALAPRGIHVRDKSSDPGCAGCIRVTAGVVDDTRAFIAALEEVTCGAA